MGRIQDMLSQQGVQLNEQQLQAVLSFERHTLLLAVPGSGKTTVIISRLASMILEHHINPQQILTVTFNRESAKDIQKRLRQLFSDVISTSPKISTIHSFCFQVLKFYSSVRQSSMPILLEQVRPSISQEKILAGIYQELTHELAGEDTLEDLANQLSFAKNSMLTEQEMRTTECMGQSLFEFYRRYESVKREHGWMDFDDMLVFTLHVFERYPKILEYFQQLYPYVNVDEAQDTSKIQHAVLQKLVGQTGCLFMVGDEDQSIYGFRGAYPQALLDFPNQYPNALILKMEENYRSTQQIVQSADCMISYNKLRYPKHMITHHEDGVPIELKRLDRLEDQYREIVTRIKGLDDTHTMAILYKNNASAIPLIDLLNRMSIDFYIKDHKVSFFRHFVVRDILNFFALSYRMNDAQLFSKLYYKMNLYLSKDMARYVEMHINEYDDVFEVLLHHVAIDEHIKDRIRFVRRKIDALKTLSPTQAIESIQYDLGYLEHIEYRAKHGFREETMTQRLSVLHSISLSYQTVEDYLTRLDELEQLIANYSKSVQRVTLSTIHSSKGLEFDEVILIDAIEGQLPSDKAVKEHLAEQDGLMEEEARLFYVAVTRAKKCLTIMMSEHLSETQIKPSRFIDRLFSKPNESSFGNLAAISAKGKIQKGTKICHKRFGIGTVAGMKSHDVVTIMFEQVGERYLFIKAVEDPSLVRLIDRKER